MSRKLCWLVTLAVTVMHAQSAFAYTATLATDGKAVRWRGGFKLNLAGNPRSTTGIDPQFFRSATVRSLQRWQSASSGTVGFDYWQGTDPSIYEPNSNYNGLSSIYFASNSQGHSGVSPNVLGLTQVWYNTNTGEILEADVILNDRDFQFTSDPRDTSGPGAGSTSFNAGKSRVFIENVITHELGHVYGLSHSGALQSAMFYMETPEQARLGCDELVGIHALYPSSDHGQRGSIEGHVVSPTGQPVFGAHVLAISRRRGVVLATTITDPNGRYAINSLEAGTYFISVEPFFAGPNALPAFYSSISSSACPNGEHFGRSFLVDGSGYRMQPVEVAGSRASSAPPIRIRCTGERMLPQAPGATRISDAPALYDGNGTGFGGADRLSDAGTTYHLLRSVEGNLEIHALSYSIYSPARARLSLLDSNGAYVTAMQLDQTYEGSSGFRNYDSALVAKNLPRGDYYIQVNGTRMESSYYPGGRTPLDDVPFIVLVGTLNEPAPALAGTIPVNGRCALNENFASYSSPAGHPPRYTQVKDDDVGFCGSMRAGGDSGSGPSTPAIIGWFLPYLMMGLIAHFMMRPGQRPRFGTCAA